MLRCRAVRPGQKRKALDPTFGVPNGSMQLYGIYLGLKVVPIPLRLGLCMYYNDTGTLCGTALNMQSNACLRVLEPCRVGAV